MKILFVMDDYFAQNNGMCISAQRFAKELTKFGHDVRIMACNANGTPDFPLNEYKVPFFDGLIKKQGVVFAKADDVMIRKAVAWADVVHLENCFVLAAHAGKIAQELGKPCTGVFHTYPENITSSLHIEKANLINKAILSGFRDIVYRYCSDIHCPTQAVAEQLANNGYTARLHVISNGVTPDFFCHPAFKPPQYAGKFVILAIGRYSKEKRQDVLIRAVQLSRYANNIQLIFAGQGPMEHKYRRLSRRLVNPPVFGFMERKELQAMMAFSDLYVHCAEVEVEGMSCLEAMAAGVVPVIASSKKSSTGSFALDSRSLFRSGNARELADHIDDWLANETERCRMAKQYSTYAKRYALTNSARAMERMLIDACSEVNGNAKEIL